ncbi:transmembrane protein (DUF2215) [Rhynchospora pubera]|uniref:Transmembrane protein (DUF2215) n=1 Tax=Rhynchospora pubera TaxID=906938 RepID=A0AAV8D7V5_9POAL|nr:transmembrane protein (DUF2215) [Rhynchospora pubera]
MARPVLCSGPMPSQVRTTMRDLAMLKTSTWGGVSGFELMVRRRPRRQRSSPSPLFYPASGGKKSPFSFHPGEGGSYKWAFVRESEMSVSVLSQSPCPLSCFSRKKEKKNTSLFSFLPNKSHFKAPPAPPPILHSPLLSPPHPPLEMRRLLLLFSLLLLSSSVPLSFSTELTDTTAVDSHPSSLVLPVGDAIVDSPGSRPGAKLTCNRVHIRGYSRLHHLSKYANALRVAVSVSEGDALFRVQTIELCFHRNASIGVGMCPASQWNKLSKNPWVQSISPYQHRIMDIRMPPDPSRTIEVTTSEEFLAHHVIFLLVGVIMMLLARTLSESLVFYYGGAMTIGIIIVVLIVLFQGMKLLPTGRKSSLAIFMYSSVVGLATFLLHYLTEFLRAVLVEIGIGEDLHIPIGTFFLVVLLLVGAWFGYWSVRKLVLTEEGSIDSGVAFFVQWCILIISAVMIFLSSLDIILSGMAFVLSLVVWAISKTEGKLRFLRRIFRRTVMTAKRTVENLSPSKYSYSQYSSMLHSSETEPTGDLYGSYLKRASYRSPSGLRTPITKTAREETYYSSFHSTPERKKFSKEEWDSFTKEHTNRGIKELVSSPEFNKWALENADRISVTPREKSNSQTTKQRQRFFSWF